VAPAQKSNDVAVRATVGLMPRDDIIPISSRQDTLGPVARTVKDVAHALTTIAGKSNYDNATSSIPFDKIPNYAKAAQSASLDNIRIGIARNALDDIHDVVVAKFNNTMKLLASTGATIVDDIQLDSVSEWNAWGSENHRQILQAEFKADIEQWCSHLVENSKNIRTLADITEATKSIPEEDYPSQDIQRWIWSEDGIEFNSPEYH
jgi:amidase